jgi:multidrug transporter EmrE-like cation transporter
LLNIINKRRYCAKSIVYLLLSAVFNVSANYVLKAYAAEKGGSFLDMITKVPIYLAVAFFGINFLFYAKALQTLNISTAYPMVVGLSTILIILLSYFFLSEKLEFIQICGIGLIIIGLVFVYIKM